MKIFEGKVISTGMTNTVVVEVFRITPHPLYRKLVRSSKKYKVDTNGFDDLIVGSVVKITEIRPMSKNKFFKISEIVGSAKQTPKVVKVEKAEKELKEVEKIEVKADIKKSTKKTTKPSDKASKDKKERK